MNQTQAKHDYYDCRFNDPFIGLIAVLNELVKKYAPWSSLYAKTKKLNPYQVAIILGDLEFLSCEDGVFQVSLRKYEDSADHLGFPKTYGEVEDLIKPYLQKLNKMGRIN